MTPAAPSQRILAICGSLRRHSRNRLLLEAFCRYSPAGVLVEMAPGLDMLPPFNPDHEGDAAPAELEHFAELVTRADGLIIAAPEYAHGIPGVLKNALDWLVSRPEIPGKPVLLVHASTRGLFVREHLSEVLRTMSVRLFDTAPFELHLIGTSPEAANAILDRADVVERIRLSIEGFAAFAVDCADLDT
ncbi:NADPH-dependent FMN reductase [Aurantimonas sp. VKM B-3413]|uniref:NADPH-dependent FMN reductase n=1 Tax=Aurantimonas sp. VKM B-3413 TaxID=2779401 RepID=UPI001E5079AE|nr:NADPH-dependent FMN reductase [Aurantimonas sp. VKM B-3413]MCB8837109.1 NAD(P)H-dependent oxidoreductase [Aurantimonas sp. VKM B-3413]